MFTVIVTGSRDLLDGMRVWDELDNLRRENWGAFFVRHGDCPTGADRFASIWTEFPDSGVYEIPCPANWDLHGKAAGPIRNREMAQAGADLCLAFPLGQSRGTWNCVNECKKAGIPVKVIK